jgi:hypothetical protein
MAAGRFFMVRGFVGSIGALALLTVLSVGSAPAQTVLTGTVQQVDEGSGVIVFDDGRQVQTTNRTIVLVERPVDRLAAVQPGTSVVVIQPDAASASPSFPPYWPQSRPYGPNSLQAP